MPDKVPLKGNGQPESAPPPLIAGGQTGSRKPSKRPKSQYERQRDRSKLWDEISGYLRLLTIIALGVGGYYVYRYYTAPEYERNDRFALMEKIIVKPVKFKDPVNTTALGAPSSVIYPPKYVFKCLGESTRDNYYVVVDEEIYYDYPLRTIFMRGDVERYQVFNSMNELQEHYSTLETAPTTEEKGSGGFSDFIAGIKNFLGLGEKQQQ